MQILAKQRLLTTTVKPAPTKDTSGVPSSAGWLKKARSAAERDEQELYCKHMIRYYTAKIQEDPAKKAEYNSKISSLKENIGEK